MNKNLILQTSACCGELLGSFMDLVVLTSSSDDFLFRDFYFI